MRLLLDENIPIDVLVLLGGHKVSARHILLLPKLSSSNDEDIFLYALRNKLTLITFDKDFLDDRFLSQSHYGIVFIGIRNKDLKIISKSILNVVRVYKSLKNKVIIIDK